MLIRCRLSAAALVHVLARLFLLLLGTPVAFALAQESGEGSARFSFVVVGDTQDDGTTGGGINDNLWPAMAYDMNALNPAFALFCGDLVSGSSSIDTTVIQWEQWKVATGPLIATRYMVPGNHDMYGGAQTYTRWTQTFPWLPTGNSPSGEKGMSYWFDVGGTRIISVTTDLHTGGTAPDQKWLDGALASAAGMDHVFVFSHRPIQFSSAESTGGSGGAFWQSLLSNDASGYFSGHWHRYQPDRIGGGGLAAPPGPYEVLVGTGGGWQGFEPIRPYQQVPGFLLVEVDGLRVTASFYGDSDEDGQYDDVLDSFVMKDSTPEPMGLVASYDFESGSADDVAPPPLGHGLDGAWRRQAEVAPGISGLFGLELDGDMDHVEAGAIDDHVLSINGDLTLGLFARYDSLGTGSWDNTFLCYGTSDYYSEDEETNYSYWLSLQSNRHLLVYWEHGDGDNVAITSTQPAPVAETQSHHYAVTRDAVLGQVRFYVDGIQLGDSVFFDHLPTGGGRGMLYLGSDTPSYLGSQIEFDGMLDDVRVYNRVLTPAEIDVIAVPRPQPGLLPIWSEGWESVTTSDWAYVNGVDGWSSETSGTSVGAWAGDEGWFAHRSGDYALQAASSGGEASGYTWKTLPVRYQAGRRYLFSVHYKRRGGTAGKNTVGVYLYKEGDSLGHASSGHGSLARSLRDEPGMPEEWHALHCAYTATDAEHGKAIVVQIHGDDTVVLDDLSLSIVVSPTTAR